LNFSITKLFNNGSPNHLIIIDKSLFSHDLDEVKKYPGVISHLYDAFKVFLVDLFGKPGSFYLFPVCLGNSLNIKYTT